MAYLGPFWHTFLFLKPHNWQFACRPQVWPCLTMTCFFLMLGYKISTTCICMQTLTLVLSEPDHGMLAFILKPLFYLFYYFCSSIVLSVILNYCKQYLPKIIWPNLIFTCLGCYSHEAPPKYIFISQNLNVDFKSENFKKHNASLCFNA